MKQPEPVLLGPIPSHLPDCLCEFVSADFPPQDDKPVLCIRKSIHPSVKYELITARYDPEFRPLNPWVMVYGDAVTDSGHPVLGWKNAFRWLQAR